VAELTLRRPSDRDLHGQGREALTSAALIYLVLCLSISSVMNWLEAKFAIPGSSPAERG
jgi:ABC-type amino acid transport system permease subunit